MTIERAGTDEAAFREVFQLLLELHREGGYFPLNAKKAAAASWAVLQHGMTWLARDAEGTAVGVVMLAEEEPYYSDGSFLQGRDFYVKPEHRKGRVGVQLLMAARAEAQARNLLCFIQIDNPDRRAKKTPMSLVAQEAGFVPLGYTLRLQGSGARDQTPSET